MTSQSLDSLLDDAAEPEPARRRHRLRRVLVGLAVVVALVVGGVLGVGLALQSRYDGQIERIGDPFAAIPDAARPAEPTGAAADALTFLLVGSDSRISAGDPTRWEEGAQRTDAIMLAHVPADRSGAYVVSLPRDSWVPVPGHGSAKVNAAFSFGGPPLLIRTVEELTGVRVDHLAVIDFEGFEQMTDSLGGVRVGTADGPVRMDGEEALAYVRERKSLPNGDLDRVERQQAWIRGVVSESLTAGTLTNPLRLNSFLDATTRSLAVDDALSIGEMRDLALSMRSVRSGDLAFLTAPVAGLGRSADGQSIVELDAERGAGLWRAMREDRMAQWLAESDAPVLAERVD